MQDWPNSSFQHDEDDTADESGVSGERGDGEKLIS